MTLSCPTFDLERRGLGFLFQLINYPGYTAKPGDVP